MRSFTLIIFCGLCVHSLLRIYQMKQEFFAMSRTVLVGISCDGLLSTDISFDHILRALVNSCEIRVQHLLSLLYVVSSSLFLSLSSELPTGQSR